MGKGTNTTTSSSSPNAGAMAAYQSLMERAGNVASQPYQPYGGELVAPVNEEQGLGISGINANAGFAQPYVNEASGYARASGSPITGSEIEGFESPYTQDVIDATERQFAHDNEVQQQGVVGNAAAQGALGGDRVGVAKAQLAEAQDRAHAPVIAGLRNQNFQTALQTALQQRGLLGNTAYSLGNLGVAGQNAGLTGANAQIGAGTLQQNTLQNLYSALYGQHATAQAFPYQQTQWLAGIDTGVGSQMGGHSETTAPPPNPLASLLGLGVAGVGAAGSMGWRPFAAAGGRIQGFAPGGGVDGNMPFAGHGWIPPNQITMGRGAPPPPSAPSMGNPGLDIGRMAASFGRGSSPAVVSRPLNINPSPFMPTQGGDVMPSAPSAAAGFGNGPIYYRGGKVQGFADGGVPDISDDLRRQGIGQLRNAFADNGIVASDDAEGVTPGYEGANIDLDKFGWGKPVEHGLPLANAEPEQAPPSPPGGFGGQSRIPPQTLRYAPEDDGGGAEPQSGFGASAAPAGDRSSLSHALMAAGLGMMASKSPFLSNAIGEGGLSGLNAYTQAEQQKVENTNKATTQRLSQKRLDIEAEKLNNLAKQTQRRIDLQEQSAKDLRDYRERQLSAGKVTPGFRIKDDGTQDFITGGPHDPKVIAAEARAKLPGGFGVPEEARGLRGQPFLDALSPGDAAIVKGLAEYTVDPKTLSTKGGHREDLMSKAIQYDPNFDQKRYNTIYSAVNRFATGKQGDQVRSFNVGIAHLGTLETLIGALNNRDMNTFNRVANAIKGEFGVAAPTNFDAARDIVSNEIIKAVVGAGGGVTDRDEAHKRISSAKSEAQLLGVINTYKDLMTGQVRGLKKQYEDSTGLKNFDDKLMPETLKQLGLSNGPSGAASQPPLQGAKQAPDGNWYVPDPNRPGKYLKVQ